MMYEAFSDRTFLDDTAKPLVSGRVTFYNHDSNDLADVFTLEGSDYVAAQNPVLLDEAGRLTATLFLQLGVYDVKVESYNGDGTYADFDLFEFGIDAPLDQINRTEVKDVEELMNLDPSVSDKCVTVTQYPRRQYVWDPEAIDNADGGVVVGSDVSPTGRWLLVWDGFALKSSVYGVIDGDVTNVNALFNYAQRIGSMNIVTPPYIELEPGSYDLQTDFVCTKGLVLDRNVYFTGSIAVPCDVIVSGRNSLARGFGNIKFTNGGCTAHSWWYPTVDGFWHSGADYFVCENTNYFTDTRLVSFVNLANKTVHGQHTLVTQYVNNSCFVLYDTTEVPDGFFDAAVDCLKVDGFKFGDHMLSHTGNVNPGLISAGHRLQFDFAPALENFEDANRWMAVMYERRERIASSVWNQYDIDLQGRTISGTRVDSKSFNSFRNGKIGQITVVDNSLSLEGITADIYWHHDTAGALSVVDSDIRVLHNHVGIASVNARDSQVTFLTPVDPADTSVTVYGGTWNGGVMLSDAHADTYAKNNQVVFRNVFITGTHIWKVNFIQMYGCTSSNKIDLYPSKSADDNYYYDAVFENNSFVGAFRLWITMWWDDDHRHYDLHGKVYFQTLKITDNRFDTTDRHGIKMLMYFPYSGDVYMYSGSTFGVTHSLGPWEYHGNSGNCPLMNPGVVENTGHWTGTYEEVVAELKWRVFYTTLYVWVPYTWVSDGSANGVNNGQNPTGRQFTEEGVTSFAYDAILFPAYVGNTIRRQEYGYRCAMSPSNWNDEDLNNKFIVNLYMGDGTNNLQTYDAGFTYFPSVTA